MSQTNYIKHMNAFFARIYNDDNLNPSHISTYLALFQFWNLNRFANPFRVARSELMRLSKINSPGTYRKCIKDLHNWEYIKYNPSNNPFKGSQFSMINIWSTTWSKNEQPMSVNLSDNEQVTFYTGSINEQDTTPSKTNKPKGVNNQRQPADENEVIEFFSKEGNTKIEAQKFWNHYESNGWKSGGKVPLQNWKAAARKWMIISRQTNLNQPGQKMNNLHTSPKKNYHEPL